MTSEQGLTYLPWTFEGAPFELQMTDKWVGFVYLMTNKTTGRKYIGKKNFWATKVSQKKNKATGKVKKTRTKIFSDWQTYLSSNEVIQAEAASGALFERQILRLCLSKSEMTYYESKLQFVHDVILSEEYYNGWIMCRVRRAHVKSLVKDKTP